jgi:hypothetical protein
MKHATILAALAALVLAVAATASGPVNGTDRANAARACNALKAANATAFGTQYATFGACTSAWAQKAHAARVAAQTACSAKSLKGKKYSDCVKAATASTLATQTTTYKNAAKACAAELAAGKDAFIAKYGTTTSNLRNAFGKCVSQHASGKSTTGKPGGTPAASHYDVTLAQLNGSGAAGTGTLLLNKSDLTVKLTLTGLEANQSHTVAITGLSSGSATCPAATADTNADGVISDSEGAVAYGSQLLALSTDAQSGTPVTIASTLAPLQTRAIVVYGKTVNGTYDATVPVACGTIVSK